MIYRLSLNVRKNFALICRVSSLFVVGRNFGTSYITVIVCNSLLWMFFVCLFFSLSFLPYWMVNKDLYINVTFCWLMARYGLFVLKVPLNPNQPTFYWLFGWLVVSFYVFHNPGRCDLDLHMLDSLLGIRMFCYIMHTRRSIPRSLLTSLDFNDCATRFHFRSINIIFGKKLSELWLRRSSWNPSHVKVSFASLY